MENTAYKRKTTTLSCDKSTREYVAAEAERLGLTQRAALARMVASYRHAQMRSVTKKEKPQIQATSGGIDMNSLMDKFEKELTDGLNRVIAYQKEQEKLFLTPLVKKVDSIKTQLENLE